MSDTDIVSVCGHLQNVVMQHNPTKIHKAIFIKLGFVYIYLHLKDSFTFYNIIL